MKRACFQIQSPHLKEKALALCAASEFGIFLDSHHHPNQHSKFKWLAAWDAKKVFQPSDNYFTDFQSFLDKNKDWCFGHFSYDLKNEIENLKSENPNEINFPKLCFFIPRFVLYENKEGLFLENYGFQNETDFLNYLEKNDSPQSFDNKKIELNPQTFKQEYLQKVDSLKNELHYGNIYEINYCIEWNTVLDKNFKFSPLSVFDKLNQKAKAPFSVFYKNKDHFLMCVSPERFLQKTGQRIISQPMKGTAARFKDSEQDVLSQKNLRTSEKERAENVMITDLVRNDLGRTAEIGSVKVDELFGVQTFETVHQMVTTVSSQLAANYTITDLLKTTFPMGSMTGAPKISAMNLIEKHENFARNLYAGAVGYITPKGDFDFNVVIRSLLYNAENQFLAARVGSAITVHCEAEKEYEECLLKVAGLLDCLR